MFRYLLLVVALVFPASCVPDPVDSDDNGQADTDEVGDDDIDGAAYVDATVDLLEERWLWTEGTDWDDLRTRYLPSGPDVSQSQAYSALERLTQALGDPGHTRFANPMVVDRLWETPHEADEPPPPSGERIGDVGYLRLPGANVFTEETYRTYATGAHETIADVDTEPACGWVVDLRDNTGGHPGPMLTALGALLGDGVMFSFVGPAVDVAWVYEAGEIRYEPAVPEERGDGLVEPSDEHPYVVDMPDDVRVLLEDDWQLGTEPYEVADLTVPIAVLTSSTTGSAGETAVVTLMDRDRTRVFGQATDGVPTRVGAAYLADGSVISFADAAATTVGGRSFDGPITPDVTVDDGGDAALDQALSWVGEMSERC